MRSLRRRLLAAGALGVLLASAAGAWLLGEAFARASQRAFDRRLGEDLDHLIALADVAADGRPRLLREPADDRYDRIFSGWYWAVSGAEGVRASRSSWDEAALEPVLAAGNAARAFVDAPGPRGQRLRVAVQRVAFGGGGPSLAAREATLAFAVAGDLAPLHAEVRDFRWFAGAAVAAIALLLAAAMGWQVAYGLRPLRGVRDTLARLRAGDEVRFDTAALPAEIGPLSAQVNELLDDHARRVQRARHAAHDLAHALKTPLSALMLESRARDDEFARRVGAHARRMQEAIERRLAGSFGADARQRTPVREVLDALASVLPRLHGNGVAMTIDADPALRFAGSREDLEEMLGNLVDNACKFARGRVHAAARVEGGRLHLTVDDDGPGLAPVQAAHALQRGVRLDARAPGSGLGLAIVQEVAAGYGGMLALARGPLGGLRAELAFAAA